MSDGLLDGDRIHAHLAEVAAALPEGLPQHRLILVGGSLLAWHGLRESTRDVDSVLALDETLRKAVATVAARHGLAPRWLNDHARVAGTAPITKASGTRRVVLARVATNKRLRDALHLQAFAALSTSPGARAYYDARRADGHSHHQVLRAVSNRLVGCLRHGALYDEATDWPRHQQDQAAA